MKWTACFALSVAATFVLGGVAPAATAEHANAWSGYVDKGATFTAVHARWVQPAVTCPAATARASFWVGFDGFGNGTVEQVGTLAECNGSGKPVVYKAWWEMVASTGNRGQEFAWVAPGDTIDATVRYARRAFVLEVRDVTSGAHFKTTKTCTATCARSMAEWIVERPGSGTYPLADFDDVHFDGASAAAGRGRSNKGIADFPNVIALTMVHANTVLSTPSSAGHGRSGFHCTWHAAQ